MAVSMTKTPLKSRGKLVERHLSAQRPSLAKALRRVVLVVERDLATVMMLIKPMIADGGCHGRG